MALKKTTRARQTPSLRSAVIGILALAPALSWGRGPSPYLPLDLAPGIERQIERVLILGGKPVMRRPIAAAVVLDALPMACERDRALCEEVRRYLDRYMDKYDVTHARAEAAITSGDSTAISPNHHGEPVDSMWRVAASGYFQPHDYVILNAGGIAYEGNATPTGSFLSVGFDFAQLDIGFRDHWLGPMSDSSSIISTEAPTMPSVTLSNYAPISPLGLSYEVFAAEMSRQRDIRYQGGTTAGKPRLAGLQVAIEPVTGYAVAVNRITQYGGGARGGSGFSDFFDALTTSSNEQDALGEGSSDVNRIASLTSSILFPGRVPFGVHIEYAGEDNTYEGKYRLGQTNLSLGIDFPILWRDFDASYEISEFQNGWYVHHIYPGGPRNEGRVLGHWFGDNREFGDAIGGLSQTLGVGWRLRSGDYLRAKYRYLGHEENWRGTDAQSLYHDLHDLTLSYSTHWRGHAVDTQLQAGRDVSGDSFARLSGSFDFGRSVTGSPPSYEGQTDASPIAEVFIDLGIQHSKVREIMLDLGPNQTSGPDTDIHVGVGARRPVSRRNDLGVRLEFDRIADSTIVSVRAVDWRYRFGRKLAVGAFLGAARYEVQLPAYGYYGGIGLQYMNLLPGWSLALDYRRHDKFSRDKVLDSDPPRTVQLPRRAFDVTGVSLYLSRQF